MASDDVCEEWDVGFLQDGLVGDCVCCGVQDFCVVGGFVVEDFAQTLAVKGIEFVGLWLCQCGRFHPICDHGDEGGFVDLELPWDCEVGVPPEQVQLVEGCSGFA